MDLLGRYNNTNSKELKKAINGIMKDTKTNRVFADMEKLVMTHKNSSLKKLRKELKKAYEMVHVDDDNESSKTVNPYHMFVKEQCAAMKGDERFPTQKERMVEIGKRWKEHKAAAAAATTNENLLTLDNQESMSDDESDDVPPPPKKRVLRKRT